MKKKNLCMTIIVIIMCILLIIPSIRCLSLAVTPDKLDGKLTNEPEIDKDFIDDITDLLQWGGTFIAVGALMIIGIRYAMGSVEEKAGYKKSMLPYVIGCFILFGASTLVPQIKGVLDDVGTEKDEVGNAILGIIQSIGSLASVAALMMLGIKYLVGSIEERATYKRTMVPYIVGIILIFLAVNLVAMLYDAIPHDGESESETGFVKNLDYVVAKNEEHSRYMI